MAAANGHELEVDGGETLASCRTARRSEVDLWLREREGESARESPRRERIGRASRARPRGERERRVQRGDCFGIPFSRWAPLDVDKTCAGM